MPFDVAGSVNTSADKITKIGGVNYIFKNPIWLAFIIVLIVMLITATVFRDVESKTSITTLVLRAGFWSFLVITTAVFLNNRIMLDENCKRGKGGEYEQLFDYGTVSTPSTVTSTTSTIQPTINMEGL